MTPESLAIAFVAERSGPMFYLRRSENPQYKQDEIDAVVALLHAYGAACAEAERERISRLFGVSASMLVDPLDEALAAVLVQFRKD